MRVYLLIILLLVIGSCKEKKKSLTGSEPATFEQFADAYPVLQLPFTVSDSTLQKVADTSTISKEIFRGFVPDTVFGKDFSKDQKIVIRPVGRIDANEKETYFATYVSSKQRSAVYLVVFNEKKFSTAMPLLASNKDEANHSASIDKKLSISINKEWMDKDQVMYHRTIYAYNNVGVFTTVLTETNEKPTTGSVAVINPLDTFPKKNKYSGDYVKGKNNLLSIRDGRNPNEYRFFVHFVTNDEDACSGNLKGELKMTSEKVGIYSEGGDPCVIDFLFEKNQVSVKEQGSCGNYRGITCFFNDTFTKKKEPKPDPKKKP